LFFYTSAASSLRPIQVWQRTLVFPKTASSGPLYWPMVILTFLLFDWSWTQFWRRPWDKLTGIFLVG
jgi:hypothetical protein